MKTLKITDELRIKLDEYLSNNYGLTIDLDDESIFLDKNNYIYMNVDNGNCIYINKKHID